MMVFGLCGSGFGLSIAFPALVAAVRTGGDPFANFFAFGCSNATAAAANATALC